MLPLQVQHRDFVLESELRDHERTSRTVLHEARRQFVRKRSRRPGCGVWRSKTGKVLTLILLKKLDGRTGERCSLALDVLKGLVGRRNLEKCHAADAGYDGDALKIHALQ